MTNLNVSAKRELANKLRVSNIKQVKITIIKKLGTKNKIIQFKTIMII